MDKKIFFQARDVNYAIRQAKAALNNLSAVSEICVNNRLDDGLDVTIDAAPLIIALKEVIKPALEAELAKLEAEFEAL